MLSGGSDKEENGRGNDGKEHSSPEVRVDSVW